MLWCRTGTIVCGDNIARTYRGAGQESVIPSATPTIADVARAAQVDKSTVSRALNGTGRVSDETRGRIMAAATSLGYRPSKFARGFRTGSTYTVGLVTPSLSAPGAADFVSGALAALAPAGFSGILCEAPLHHEGPRSVEDVLTLDFPVDGALLLPGTGAEHRRALRRRGVDVVDARQCVEGEHARSGEYAVALEAFRVLVRNGHQHIAIIEAASDIEDERHTARRDALEDALAESPLHSVGEARAHEFRAETPDEAGEIVGELVQHEAVTAIVLGSEVLLASTLAGMQDAGALPGRELSLLSVMHSTATAALHPRISALVHHTRWDGRQAAARLLGQVAPGAVAPDSLDGGVHWEFRLRASVAASPTVPNC